MDLMDRTAARYVVGETEGVPAGLLRVLSQLDHCDDALEHTMLSVECPNGTRRYVSGGDVRPATAEELLALVFPAAPAPGSWVMPRGGVVYANRPVPLVPQQVAAVQDWRGQCGDPSAVALVLAPSGAVLGVNEVDRMELLPVGVVRPRTVTVEITDPEIVPETNGYPSYARWGSADGVLGIGRVYATDHAGDPLIEVPDGVRFTLAEAETYAAEILSAVAWKRAQQAAVESAAVAGVRA